MSHAGQEDSEGGEEGRVRVRQPWSRRLLGECTRASPCEALGCARAGSVLRVYQLHGERGRRLQWKMALTVPRIAAGPLPSCSSARVQFSGRDPGLRSDRWMAVPSSRDDR